MKKRLKGKHSTNVAYLQYSSSIAPTSQRSFADIKAQYQATTSEDADVRDRFPSSFDDIPDAKAVYEARKKREFMRATGGVQPAIPLATHDDSVIEDRHARQSRLVREDDDDMSDDENGDSCGYVLTLFICTCLGSFHPKTS